MKSIYIALTLALLSPQLSYANTLIKNSCLSHPFTADIFEGNEESVRSYVAQNIDINRKNTDNITPLMCAIAGKQRGIVEIFLENRNLNLDANFKSGCTDTLEQAVYYTGLGMGGGTAVSVLGYTYEKLLAGKTGHYGTHHYVVPFTYPHFPVSIRNLAAFTAKKARGVVASLTIATWASFSKAQAYVVRYFVPNNLDMTSLHLAAYVGDVNIYQAVEGFLQLHGNTRLENTKSCLGLTTTMYAVMSRNSTLLEYVLKKHQH